MRLLKLSSHGEISLTKDFVDDAPRYAILSHTWGRDEDEVTFHDLENGSGTSKAGYAKLQFCGKQAKKDGLDYFWVDTCCIDKSSSAELTEAINSMFRWYQDASNCYVYLSDVSTSGESISAQLLSTAWKAAFRQSRWFTRGWTLQELIAPTSVEFYSLEGHRLGSKKSLEQQIHEIAKIAIKALRGAPLTDFEVEERLSWTTHRETKRQEDKAYSLLGIFNVHMPLIYGEGNNAFVRLREAIDQSVKPSLAKIDAVVRNNYLRDGCLTIERLSGRHLPMDRCFINLGIVDHLRDSDRKKSEDDSEKDSHTTRHPSRFSIASRLKVETPSTANQVTLQTLFKARKRPDRTTMRPNRILIWGRAGVGKSTLCKKIVYDFIHNNLWSDLFSRVYWLPLRRLKMMRNLPKSVEQLIQSEYLPNLGERQLLGQVLRKSLENDGKRTLFVLDGLDEVSYAWDPDTPLGRILNKLLNQDNIIITSRPHSTYVLDHISPDLELETIGFFPAQVEAYLESERNQAGTPEQNLSEIRSFIQSHPLVHSLARIPIQLDAICYAWSAKRFARSNVTMTVLYQAITQQLWEKDIVRLEKKVNGERITRQQIQGNYDGKRFVKDEVNFLQELAFACLCNEIVEFDSEHIGQVDAGQGLIWGDHPVHLSFLRSSDSSLSPADRTYHFIHLTFQEFFAAQHFVQQWTCGADIRLRKMDLQGQRASQNTERVKPEEFIGREKYSARYDIFWRFVVGILHSKEDLRYLHRFFDVVENEPRDLLGSTHQRLIIHCLSEIDTVHEDFEPRSRELEDLYWKWIIFESKINSSTALMQEAECPDRLLRLLIPWAKGSNKEMIRIMQALTHRPNVSSEVLDQVISQLDKPDDGYIHSAAFQLLGNHCNHISGKKFFDCFPLQYKTPRLKFVEALAKSQILGRSAVEALVRLLQDEDSDIRRSATNTLGGQTTLPASAVEALVRLLQDEDSDIRWSATNALGGQTTLPASAVEALVRLLQDEDSDVRWSAANALRGQTTLPASAVEALVRLLQDEDFDVRRSAADALGGQTTLPASAVEALVRLLQDEDSDIRRSAADALRGQTTLPASAVEALVRLLQDEDSDIRRSAADALGGQTTLPASAVEALVPLLEEPETLGSNVAWILASCEYFYSLVPTLASSTLQSLLRFWLQRSFTNSAICFVRNSTVFIDIDGKVRKIPLEKGQRQAFKYAYLEAQAAVGVPQPTVRAVRRCAGVAHSSRRKPLTSSKKKKKKKTY